MKKIIYSTILVIIFSLGLGSYFIYNSYITTKEITLQRLENQNTIITNQIANYFESYFAEYRRLLSIMSNSPEIQYYSDNDNTIQFMQKYFENFQSKALLDIARIDKKGIIRIALKAPEINGKDISSRDYFQWALRPENKNKVFVSSALKSIGVDPGTISVAIASPIYETVIDKLHPIPSNEFSGVLVFIIQLKNVLKETFQPIYYLEKSESWLIEDNGNILYAELHNHLVGENLFTFLAKNNKKDLLDFIKSGFKQIESKGFYSCLFEMKKDNDTDDSFEIVCTYSINLIERKWLIGICTPEEVFMQQVYSTFKTSILSTNLIILSFCFIGIALFIFFQNFYKIKIRENEKKILEGKIKEKTEELNNKNKELETKSITLLKLNQDLELSKIELQQSEEKYKMIVESSFAGIAIIQNNVFVFINKKFLKILEYSENELIDSNYLTLVHPDNKEQVEKSINQILNKEIASCNFEIKMLSKFKKNYNIDLWLNTIEFNKQKAVRMSLHDISQAKQYEKELKNNKDKLEAIFNSITDAINIVDKNYIIIEANKGRANLHGKKLEDMIGKHCYEVFQNKKDVCDECPVKETFSTKKPAYRERKAIKPDRTQVIADVFTFPIFNDTNEVYFVVEYARDITEKKLLENELFQTQKIESIGTLAGGIAHDFNNLISAILGYTSYIKSEVNIDGYLYQQLEVIESAATKASELTRQLLAISRKEKINTESISINKIAEDTIKLLSHSINKNVKIQTKFFTNLSIIDGNESQIQNAMLNICLNAIDAMPDGGELLIETYNENTDEISVKQHIGLKTGEYAVISITDNGLGMDEETKTKIFEPFFTTKKNSKRTGLGMSMVYKIVKNHNGYIYVYSNKGKGTTIKIYLPAIRYEITNNKTDIDTQISALEGNETILVIDNEVDIRNICKNILESKGYKVYTAIDEKDALDMFNENYEKISLVVLEMHSKEKNTIEIIEKIREKNPDLKIIISTGISNINEIKKSLKISINDFIQKPFKMTEILKKVRMVLDKG